jgi:two-component system cell cycle sensor histidine kinase/response regulator CckA
MQVLQSLCINAREAMQGSGRLTVQVSAVTIANSSAGEFPELSPGSYVEFSVTDTGPGIPEGIRHRIFDPFFTTKEGGRGAGLGLPTALSVMRSLQGTIRFSSDPGVETRFTILVPVACAGTAAKPAPTPARENTLGSSLRGRRVLLADDDLMVREVARRVLQSAGMKVVVVADGQEAIDAVARGPQEFDLAVLDMVMPLVDGPTAARAIRGLRPDLPMIGASGYASESVREQAEAVGFVAFLMKPYTMDGLIDAVNAALRRPAIAP